MSHRIPWAVKFYCASPMDPLDVDTLLPSPFFHLHRIEAMAMKTSLSLPRCPGGYPCPPFLTRRPKNPDPPPPPSPLFQPSLPERLHYHQATGELALYLRISESSSSCHPSHPIFRPVPLVFLIAVCVCLQNTFVSFFLFLRRHICFLLFSQVAPFIPLIDCPPPRYDPFFSVGSLDGCVPPHSP